MRHGGPADAEAQRCNAGHAEAEDEDREDELVVSPAVDLKDEHVRGGGDEVDEEHHRADRDVHGNGGHPTQLSCCGRIWRPWGGML